MEIAETKLHADENFIFTHSAKVKNMEQNYAQIYEPNTYPPRNNSLTQILIKKDIVEVEDEDEIKVAIKISNKKRHTSDTQVKTQTKTFYRYNYFLFIV